MTEFTTFKLKNKAVVQVESSRVGLAPAARGPVEASTTGDRAWKDGAALVAEVGAEVVDAMRQAFAGVDEVSLEFGANISGRSGVILVEGTASANFKVSVKWKNTKRGEGG